MNSGCDMRRPVPQMDLSKADALAAKTSPALLKALAEEVQQIVKDGINIRSLMELSKFSHVAQELLMVRTPLGEVRRKKRGAAGMSWQGGSSYSIGGSAMMPYQTMYDEDLEPMTQEAQQNETFGATLSRELVSAIGAIKNNNAPSTQELIERIAQAKESGLDNVVAMLEKSLATLLGGDEVVVDAEAAPSTNDSPNIIDVPSEEPKPGTEEPLNSSPEKSAEEPEAVQHTGYDECKDPMQTFPDIPNRSPGKRDFIEDLVDYDE